MNILLYNPLSRNGKKIKLIEKIIKRLTKTGEPIRSFSVLDIQDQDAFMKELKTDDKVIVVGGDGTINRLANAIYGLDIKQDLFMYQAGTGNDFIRSLKTKSKIVPIKKHISNLPQVEIDGNKRYFLNGAGAGLDGFIGHLVNHSKFKKNKLNYFRHAFEGFAKFKPVAANIIYDGKHIREEKLWFASMMHGAYFGGGMKIAPNAKREVPNLHLVTVKNVSKIFLFLIFPTIYLGIHTWFKRWVTIYEANSIEIEFDEATYLQIDGDVEYPIKRFKTISAK
jgi:diacylglycerol kinase (ATP)